MTNGMNENEKPIPDAFMRRLEADAKLYAENERLQSELTAAKEENKNYNYTAINMIELARQKHEESERLQAEIEHLNKRIEAAWSAKDKETEELTAAKAEIERLKNEDKINAIHFRGTMSKLQAELAAWKEMAHSLANEVRFHACTETPALAEYYKLRRNDIHEL